VWVQAELCRDPLVLKRRNGPDDVIRKLLLLSNGHDGLMAVRCGFVPDRVICHNTLTAAHESGASQLFRLTHTKKVEAALSAIRETINVVDGVFEATGELYRKLARTDLDRDQIVRYVKLVFGFDADADLKTRAQKLVDDVLAKAFNGIGTEGATAWDAYNGVTEALSHTVGRNRETRLNSLWYGDAAQTNRNAFKAALALVK
jgi:phage/plasmid-like protein (TIGR03299 family)